MLDRIPNFMAGIIVPCEIFASILILGFMVGEFGVILGFILTLVFFPVVFLVVPLYELLVNDFWVTAALTYLPIAAALLVAILITLLDSSGSR